MANQLYKRFGANTPLTVWSGDERVPATSSGEAGAPDIYFTPNQFWQAFLQERVQDFADELFSLIGHKHPAADISDASILGREILRAPDEAHARYLIGAQATVIMMSELEAIQGTSDAQRLTSPRLQQVAATTAVKKIGAVPAVAEISGAERLVAITGAPADGPSGHVTTGSLWNGFLRALVLAEGNARYSALGHTHTAIQITDATDVGRQVLTASTAIAARAAMGAQEAVPAMTEQEALDGAVTDQRTVSPRVLAIGAAKHGGGGGGSGLVPMTSAEAVAGVGTDARSVSPAVLKAGVDARVDARLSGATISMRPSLHLDFTRQALDPRIRFERASEAWEYNSGGVLVKAAVNVWPIVHDAAGRPLGRAVYQQLINKLAVRKHNPVDTSGWARAGFTTTTFDAVTDSAELRAIGLEGFGPPGSVYKLDNSAGSGSASVTAAGTTGNVNVHTASVLWRGAGSGVVSFWGGEVVVAMPSGWQRATRLAATPSVNNAQFYVKAAAGGIIYFVLPQLIEANFPGPFIPGDTLAATMRSADSAVLPLAGLINPVEGAIVCRWRADALPSGNRGPWWVSKDGTTFSNGMCVRYAGTGGSLLGFGYRQDGTTFQNLTDLHNTAAGQAVCAAVRWRPGEIALSVNGRPTVKLAATTGAMGGNLLHLGDQRLGGSDTGPLNGPLQWLDAYLRAPTDLELQALSSQ